MNKKLFAINLNFDSLGEAYGWPSDFHEDAAFTKGVDRILNLSQKFNIPIPRNVVPGETFPWRFNLNCRQKIRATLTCPESLGALCVCFFK